MAVKSPQFLRGLATNSATRQLAGNAHQKGRLDYLIDR